MEIAVQKRGGPVKFVRRVTEPVQRLLDSPGGSRCPEVWEMDSGDFAVIGADITDEAKKILPPEVELGIEERIVMIPRAVLNSLKPNI